ncbi:MAG: hypothetical protein DI598_11995 [Pseudopedobacter saltans]|uniref:Uncharacterized protein n=1 Tax=Pseudopedobacter saltans TaxID=151895 RepID=A0A2W5ERA1_9SPHI|nr:MAG: hypothetical protein DI598_11995 [Pseudopedobacter saltans]
MSDWLKEYFDKEEGFLQSYAMFRITYKALIDTFNDLRGPYIPYYPNTPTDEHIKCAKCAIGGFSPMEFIDCLEFPHLTKDEALIFAQNKTNSFTETFQDIKLNSATYFADTHQLDVKERILAAMVAKALELKSEDQTKPKVKKSYDRWEDIFKSERYIEPSLQMLKDKKLLDENKVCTAKLYILGNWFYSLEHEGLIIKINDEQKANLLSKEFKEFKIGKSGSALKQAPSGPDKLNYYSAYFTKATSKIKSDIP